MEVATAVDSWTGASIDVTTAVNAAPMTTATARSITFPRRMNSLKPLSTAGPFYAAEAEDGGDGGEEGEEVDEIGRAHV